MLFLFVCKKHGVLHFSLEPSQCAKAHVVLRGFPDVIIIISYLCVCFCVSNIVLNFKILSKEKKIDSIDDACHWNLGFDMAMDQYLYIPFLGGWTSIYQLFWCSPGVQGFDPSPYGSICFNEKKLGYFFTPNMAALGRYETWDPRSTTRFWTTMGMVKTPN